MAFASQDRALRSEVRASIPLSRMFVDLPLSVIFFTSLSYSFWHLTFYLRSVHLEFIYDPALLPITALLLVATAAFMPGEKNIHAFVMCLFVYTLWLPVLVWFMFGGGAPFQVIISGLVMIALRCIGFIKVQRFVFRPVPSNWIIIGTLIFSSTLALWALAVNGVSFMNFQIYAVYEFRRAAAAGLPRVFQYLWPQVANALIPLAVALCLAERRRISFFLLVIIAVLLFSVVHHKGILFMPFFAAIVFYVFNHRPDLTLFKVGFMILGFFGALEAFYLNSFGLHDMGMFNTLISRRVLLVPAQLDGMYLEFFADNARYYWSMSRITLGFIESPYDVTAPFAIGETYFGRMGTSSNTGLIGTGFANAGLLGIVAYVIILGAGLCLLEAHAAALSHAVVITASIFIVYNALTASDIVTLMLTGGFGSLILFLSVLKPQE